MTEAFPLQWPEAWPRTSPSQRKRAAFGQKSSSGYGLQRRTITSAFNELYNELRMLGASNVVLSSNLRRRLDGSPIGDQRQPEDPGVAVYFVLDKVEKCMPIDRWDRVEDNMVAIAKCINALRGMDRWGAKNFINAAFRGFAALPPPDGYEAGSAQGYTKIVRSFYDITGINPQITDFGYLEYSYKSMAKRLQPDNGGNNESMQELNEAWAKLKKEMGQ